VLWPVDLGKKRSGVINILFPSRNAGSGVPVNENLYEVMYFYEVYVLNCCDLIGKANYILQCVNSFFFFFQVFASLII
jgi:hypothetical protein